MHCSGYRTTPVLAAVASFAEHATRPRRRLYRWARWLAVPFVVALAVATACRRNPSLPTRTAVMPTPAQSPIPATVARVIKLVESHDISGLVRDLAYQRLACVSIEQEGSPPACQSPESIGAIIDAFPIGGCGGMFVRAGQVQTQVAAVLTTAPYSLYSVFRPVSTRGSSVDYRVVFAYSSGGRQPAEGFWLDVSADRIVDINRTCTGIAAAVSPTLVKQFLIPPPISTPRIK